MRTMLKALLIHNWPRKCLSIILAISIWFLVNNSLTTTKTIYNVPVKIENVPKGKVVEEAHSHHGRMIIDLTLTGKKSTLQELNTENTEVVFNAERKEGQWIATISKDNVRSTNPNIDISKGVSHVSQQNFIIRIVNLVTAKIPVIITPPIGAAPKGYQFIGVWPHELYVTVAGPEKWISKLSKDKVNLTFNLNKIDKSELDDLTANSLQGKEDVVSFSIPNLWKKVFIPQISPQPILIDDPDAKELRIDFLREELLKINSPIPIALYFPPLSQAKQTPQNTTIAPSKLFQDWNGIRTISGPLYAKGVSPFFLEIIKNMMEIVIVVRPNTEHPCLDWGLQLINSTALENRYVQALLSDSSHNEAKEGYLRSRFRAYANHFQLFRSKDKKFTICSTISGDSIVVTETTGSPH